MCWKQHHHIVLFLKNGWNSNKPNRTKILWNGLGKVNHSWKLTYLAYVGTREVLDGWNTFKFEKLCDIFNYLCGNSYKLLYVESTTCYFADRHATHIQLPFYRWDQAPKGRKIEKCCHSPYYAFHAKIAAADCGERAIHHHHQSSSSSISASRRSSLK